MRILVDADACPVKNDIIKAAKPNNIDVLFFVNIHHQIHSDYASVIVVDDGADSVDLKLINTMLPGDVIVSQDYGVASLALGKGGLVLTNSGRRLDESNIDLLMFERHMSRKARQQGKRGPHIKKRTAFDNEQFMKALLSLIHN